MTDTANADVLVGVDVGGTKTHVRAATADGRVVREKVFATRNWRGAPYPTKATLIGEWLADTVGSARVAALGVGAHGCDTPEQCKALRVELAGLLTVPCDVVNDAQLLGLAAGQERVVCLIAGTGSIAVGTLSDGSAVHAGGWGWLLGDDGGAAGIVREATRSLLRAVDDDRPDPILEKQLTTAAGVAGAADLSMWMMLNSATVWTGSSPAVFRAAEEGSPLAAEVITAAGDALARLVIQVLAKGAVADSVLAGGGVIVNQPPLADALRDALARGLPDLPVAIVTDLPVSGAVRLAQRVRKTSHSVAGTNGVSATTRTSTNQ